MFSPSDQWSVNSRGAGESRHSHWDLLQGIQQSTSLLRWQGTELKRRLGLKLLGWIIISYHLICQFAEPTKEILLKFFQLQGMLEIWNNIGHLEPRTLPTSNRQIAPTPHLHKSGPEADKKTDYRYPEGFWTNQNCMEQAVRLPQTYQKSPNGWLYDCRHRLWH